jgi:hypothetical protein
MATTRQISAINKISENLRKKKAEPLGKILRDAGYSQSVSESPTVVTNTKSWKELMDEYIPEYKILKRLNQILEKGKDENSTKAIDIATKMRGRYAPSKIELTNPEDEMSDEELDDHIKKLEEEAKKRMEVKHDSTKSD